MKKKYLLFFGIGSALFFTIACEKTPQPVPTPTAAPTLIAAVEPLSMPQPTPAPVGPDFKAIRKNREVMNPEQIDKYGKNMAGKKIEGWIGYVEKVVASAEENGKSRLVIDMDRETGGVPDVILEGIPTELAQRFQPRQELNFSGTIQGYVDTPDIQFLLSLSEVRIFGYL